MASQRTSSFKTGFLLALLLLAPACAGNSSNGGDETGGGAETVTLEVSAVDNSFDPSSLSAPAGSEVTVEVANEGNNPHTFTIDDPEVDTSTIEPGDSATATFTMPESAVTFYCTIHGEDMMSGTVDPS